MMTLRQVIAGIAILAGLALASGADARDWPQKPVKIIVPFAAGGNTDTIARIIGQSLSEKFGQQFVVENRAGAAGSIAAESVARAPADGYTLLMGSPSQMTILPLTTKTPYDPIKDFMPISIVGTNPSVLSIHAGIPAKTLPEFVAYARSQPKPLTYGATGIGSIVHLTTVLFLKRAGLDMTAVFYKGGAPALTDVLAGHISMYVANLSDVVPYAGAGGGLRVLAISDDKRSAKFPELPTFIESGFPGFRTRTWNGLLAPAGTPRSIVDDIAAAVAEAVKDPKLAEKLDSIGVDPLGNSPEEFAALMQADSALWGEAVKIAGAQPN